MADKRCFVQFPHPEGEHKPDGSDKIGWNKTRRNNRPNNHKRKFMQFPGKWTAGSPTVVLAAFQYCTHVGVNP